MIKDETTGNVAITYYQNTNKKLRMGNDFYIFAVKNNVNFAWVKPEHVDLVLATTRVCCGGSRKTVFRYTTDQEYRVWNGAER